MNWRAKCRALGWMKELTQIIKSRRWTDRRQICIVSFLDAFWCECILIMMPFDIFLEISLRPRRNQHQRASMQRSGLKSALEQYNAKLPKVSTRRELQQLESCGFNEGMGHEHGRTFTAQGCFSQLLLLKLYNFAEGKLHLCQKCDKNWALTRARFSFRHFQ